MRPSSSSKKSHLLVPNFFLLLLTFHILLLSPSQIIVSCQSDSSETSSLTHTDLNLNELTSVSVSEEQTTTGDGYNYFKVENIPISKDESAFILITIEAPFDGYFMDIYTLMVLSSEDENPDNSSMRQFPNANNTDSQTQTICQYQEFGTCALALPSSSQPNQTLTLYIGLDLYIDSSLYSSGGNYTYTIEVEFEDTFPIHVGHQYKVNFTNVESGLMTINSSEISSYEQIIVQMTYQNFENVGKFRMYAGIGELPNSFNNRIESQYIGAFSQMLVLSADGQSSEDGADDSGASSESTGNDNVTTFYVVIEGEEGTTFDLSVKSFSESSPQLPINDTVFYYTSSSNNNLTFQQSLPLPTDYIEFYNEKNSSESSPQVLPLYIDMSSLGGYGEFAIDYCDGMTNLTFANLNGQSGEAVISPQERRDCFDWLLSGGDNVENSSSTDNHPNNGLLLENIIVRIESVIWYFSFSVGLFEGQYPLYILPFNEKLGTLMAEQEQRVYSIESFYEGDADGDDGYHMVLSYWTISGDELDFDVEECHEVKKLFKKNSTENCTKLSVEESQNGTSSYDDGIELSRNFFNFTYKSNHTYKLIISHRQQPQSSSTNASTPASDSEYSVLLLPSPVSPFKSLIPLTPSQPITNIILENTYSFYVINLTQIKQQNKLLEPASSPLPDGTTIEIRLTETNGQCLLLTSTERQFPTSEMIFENNTVVNLAWKDRDVRTIGSGDDQEDPNLEAIYVSVLGVSEALYNLQVAIVLGSETDRDDTSESFVKLLPNKVQTFTVPTYTTTSNASSSHHQKETYISFEAHSIPYTIIISPFPSCIKYSYSLPFSNSTDDDGENAANCRELPIEITSRKIYLKLSNPVLQESSSQSQEGANSSEASTKDLKISIYVYTGRQYLFENMPVWVACLEECYEEVMVYLRQETTIVHTGMGNVGLIEDDEQESQIDGDSENGTLRNRTTTFENEKFTLSCANDSYPCILTLNASLPYGGQMQLFYDSSNIQEIEWLQQPLTFASQWEPRYFYTHIWSSSSINSAIFYTDGLTLNCYYNIYQINEDEFNALNYQLPSSFDSMKASIGNPLRRIHILEFDKELIEEIGCTKNPNTICIAMVAVYPNIENMEFQGKYITESVGYFSANTYQQYIPINSPYKITGRYELVYFTHELVDGEQISNDGYWVRVEPLSSCRPQIYSGMTNSNNSTDSDTDGDIFTQTKPSWGELKIDRDSLQTTSAGNSPKISFSIVTEQPCEYSVWLMDSSLKPVLSNIAYYDQSSGDGYVAFVFNSKFLWNSGNGISFDVEFNTAMEEISLKLYEKFSNGSISYPNQNNNLARSTNSKTLSYQNSLLNTAEHTYLILAKTPDPNQQISYQVTTSDDEETILKANSEHSIQFIPEEAASSDKSQNQQNFIYYTNSDFLLFVAPNEGQIKVSVIDYQRFSTSGDELITEQIMDEKSDPWIKINTINAGDIRRYLISIENVLQSDDQREQSYPRVKVHVENTGTVGLTRLYEGVAIFDAFYQQNAQNCYKYLSDQIVGRDQLNIDLIFSALASEPASGSYPVQYRITIPSSDPIKSNLITLPTGYRLKTSYYTEQTYEICFSASSSLINAPYYIMVENTASALPHITLDSPMVNPDPSYYNIFEYVSTSATPQNLLISVINCHKGANQSSSGISSLQGSKNYYNIYIGTTTELEYLSMNNDNSGILTMATAKNISQGYYYLGLKQENFQDRYKVIVEKLPQQNSSSSDSGSVYLEKLYQEFDLEQQTIKKAKAVEQKQQEGEEMMRVYLPEVVTKFHLTAISTFTTEYHLIMDNITNYLPSKGIFFEGEYLHSTTLARCPELIRPSTRTFEEFTLSRHHSYQEQRQQRNGEGVKLGTSDEDSQREHHHLGKEQNSNADGENDEEDSPYIDIPFSQVPNIFNLTGYVKVTVNGDGSSSPTTLTYYYESSTFKNVYRGDYDDDGDGLSGFSIFFIISLVAGGLVGIWMIYRKYKGRISARVAFEMATYNHGHREDTNDVPESDHSNNRSSSSAQNKKKFLPETSPTKRSIRKALNKDVGYGEFVDESM